MTVDIIDSKDPFCGVLRCEKCGTSINSDNTSNAMIWNGKFYEHRHICTKCRKSIDEFEECIKKTNGDKNEKRNPM